MGRPQTERPEGFSAVEINLLILAAQEFRRFRIARPWSNQIRDAMGICGKHYGVKRADLINDDRSPALVEIRLKVMAFVHVVTGKNYHEIGDEFERAHSAVIHACDKYEKAIRTALTPVE